MSMMPAPRFGPVILLTALAVSGISLLVVPDWPEAIITVSTVPTGCRITSENGVSWLSPAAIPVPGGGLRIRIEKDGWIPVDTLLHGGDTGAVTVHLGSSFPISISSTPCGASLRLDGVLVGTTPCLVSVDEPGVHSISLYLDNGITVTDSVCIISSTEHEFHFDIPSPAALAEDVPEMLAVPSGFHRVGDVYTGRMEAFLIGRYEVTNEQYAAFLSTVDPGALSDSTCLPGRTFLLDSIAPCNWHQPVTGVPGRGYHVEDGYADHPVTGISREGMQMYCSWLTSRDETGTLYRLPTREEWIVSAAGGLDGPYSWGQAAADDASLNLSDSHEPIMRRCPGITDGFSETAPRGSYPANSWGLFDMSGNVWEACEPGIAMGGSWISDSSDCRIDSSIELGGNQGYAFVGFRIAGVTAESSMNEL